MSDTETETTDPEQETAQDAPGATESDTEPEDDPEAEEDSEDDPEASPEHEDGVQGRSGPQTEKELERYFATLEKEATRHANRLMQIMGDEASGYTACELCPPNTPGFRPVGVPPDAIVAQVRVAIGLADFTDLAKAEHVRECDKCRGRGGVLSGSRVQGKEVVQCPACNGDGFLRIGGTPTPVVPAAGNGTPEVVLASHVEPPTDRDPWGRDPLDPDFGVMPNLVAQRHAVQGAA